MTDRESCHHIQWAPLLDEQVVPVRNEKGEIKHWVCSCGVIVPDPVTVMTPEDQRLFFEELVRATRELVASPVDPKEGEPETNLRRGLKAALDEYDASEDS